LTARLIPLGELTDRDLSAWRELAGRAAEPNPFFDPDFTLPAARGLGRWDEVAILCAEEGGDWIACLPAHRPRRWHNIPLPSLVTWHHTYCFLGTPLVASGQVRDGLASIVDRMREESERAGFAALDWVSADGPIGNALRDLIIPQALLFEGFSRATVEKRPLNDYLEGRIKGKHRREFRRLAGGLEAKLGGPLELLDRSGDSHAVEKFLGLEEAGWKGHEGTALAANPGHADFFRQMTRAFSERGELQLLFLEGGGEVVAARCDLVAGDASFCFKVAYDERFQRFSPGRELELRLIDRFHDDLDLKWMDSCADRGSTMFDRLWPDRRALATTVYPASRPVGAALRGTIWARKRLRRERVD
jgi:CelD/BcsL family acetyltransferase involved in cellulose biosynthesis